MKIFILFTFILSLPAMATVMESGHKLLRVEHNQGSGDDLYVGSDKKSIATATAGEFDQFNIASTSFLTMFGTGDSGEVDLGLTYSQVDVGTNTFEGLSELMTRYRHEVFANDIFDIDLGIGFRTPGNNRGGDRFDALNDGQFKYDYHFNGLAKINRFQLGLSARLTDRSDADSKSQSLIELSAATHITEKLYARTFYQMFRTRDGLDISDANFGGRFSQVKEDWNAVGLTVGYQLINNLGADLTYAKKLSNGARNTNSSQSIILGLNYEI